MLRDGKWKNLKLQQMKIDPNDSNNIIVREDKGNLIYGYLFETRFNKIKKYTKDYKEWEQDEKSKNVKTHNPYFVPDFSFHSKYREMLFNLLNLDKYIIEYRIRSALPELSEDDQFDMAMSFLNHFKDNPEDSTSQQKWDKLRELIRNSKRE